MYTRTLFTSSTCRILIISFGPKLVLINSARTTNVWWINLWTPHYIFPLLVPIRRGCGKGGKQSTDPLVQRPSHPHRIVTGHWLQRGVLSTVRNGGYVAIIPSIFLNKYLKKMAVIGSYSITLKKWGYVSGPGWYSL